ncbi:MAG: hypothetical protein KGJ23_06365 [Euryarchaeota archaeon]|nr:hypothetical protein [Euryarchaeota archaeon]MDE1836224.1 hypothetical protein [Euryarchaeota archaeon]MDE1880877.1 hypothetical protein [Euryarchaeota archaeon]MDE2045015.1 hypothetical protein [Thermoplasmata archaeon]
MTATEVVPRLVRMSETAMWVLFVGLILILASIVDLLDGTVVISAGGSAVLLLVGALLSAVAVYDLWLSRSAWAYDRSAPRRA